MKKSVNSNPSTTSSVFPRPFVGAERCIGRTFLLRPEDMVDPFESASQYFDWAFALSHNAGKDFIMVSYPKTLEEALNAFFSRCNVPWRVVRNSFYSQEGDLYKTDRPSRDNRFRHMSITLLKERLAYVKNLDDDGAELTLLNMNHVIYWSMYKNTLPHWGIDSAVADLVRKNWDEIADVIQAAGWQLEIDQLFMKLVPLEKAS